MIFGILSLLNATLTLPGIAAIALALGMAIDANVLINERIREELRAGATPQAAIHAGYERAFGTIVCEVVDVSQPTAGQIKVHRVDCVVDCGVAVNPDVGFAASTVRLTATVFGLPTATTPFRFAVMRIVPE